ncbi:MAG: alpha amylase C-terminal domain-containing protein, partial [Clostridia bacterium]|nr:alpha amylase C-terminal domain-containing protein [Clostridia bacterium]
FKEWDYQTGLDWLLLDYEAHRQFQQFVKALNAFYLASSPLWSNDFSWEGFSWIAHDDRDNSVIAFRRRDRKGKEQVILCHFTPVTRENYRIGIPKPGRWREVFSTDAAAFGGSGIENGITKTQPIPLHGQGQSVSLTLPPLSVLVLEQEKPKRTTSQKKTAR